MKYIQFDLPDKSTWQVPFSVFVDHYHKTPNDHRDAPALPNPTDDDIVNWANSDEGPPDYVIGPHAVCVHQPISEFTFAHMTPMHDIMWESCQHSNLVIAEDHLQ